MIGRIFTAAACALAAFGFGASQALAQEAIALPSTTKWKMDYAESHCDLTRQFSDGENTVTLSLSSYEPGGSFAMVLFVEAPGLRFKHGEADVTMGALEVPESEFYFARSGRETILIFKDEYSFAAAAPVGETILRPGSAPMEAARKAESIALGGLLREPVALQTGSLAPAMKALQQCTANLVAYWGLDAELIGKLTRYPKALRDGNEMLFRADFPVMAASRRSGAIVRVRVLVDETGAATDCLVQISTGSEPFDRATCEGIMRRGRFSPALDSQGNPVPWYWTTRVTWTSDLPGNEQM
ncbi:TonB family protein [Paraurantiacibacter namhicola]|nr:TonB family protein [Paraurantiacibacter namhicola]